MSLLPPPNDELTIRDPRLATRVRAPGITWADTDTTQDDIRMSIQNAFQAGVAPPQGSISILKTNPDGSQENMDSQTPVTWKPSGTTTVKPNSAIMNTLDWSTPFFTKS